LKKSGSQAATAEVKNFYSLPTARRLDWRIWSYPELIKVFWFFFSKKNGLLSCPLLSARILV
jgi:hypothetical protein